MDIRLTQSASGAFAGQKACQESPEIDEDVTCWSLIRNEFDRLWRSIGRTLWLLSGNNEHGQEWVVVRPKSKPDCSLDGGPEAPLEGDWVLVDDSKQPEPRATTPKRDAWDSQPVTPHDGAD